MEYKEIKNEKDLEAVKKMFGNFHDSCITEIRYESGSFLDERKMLFPLNEKRTVIIEFIRISDNNSTLSLIFEEIQEFHLVPYSPPLDSIISDAYFHYYKNKIYWAYSGNFQLGSLNENISWVSSNKCFYIFN